MRIPALAAAAVLALGLAACSDDATTPAQTATPAMGDTATPAASPAATPAMTATTTAGDQSTPEAAAENALKTLSAGDVPGACRYVSDGARPVAGNAQDEATCQQVLQGFIAGVPQDQLANLENASVEGATINGTNATFDNAQTDPPMPQLAQLTATQIDDKWYLVLF